MGTDKGNGNFWPKFATVCTIFLAVIFQLIAFIFKIYVGKLEELEKKMESFKGQISQEILINRNETLENRKIYYTAKKKKVG